MAGDINDVAIGIGGALGGAAAAYAASEAWRRAAERTVLDGKPASSVRVDAGALTSEPELFQFKSGGDQSGVTDRLQGVKKWNAAAAGKVMVYEHSDGRQVIADGHQRLGLAKRLMQGGHEPIKLDAIVLRERDGWAPRDVRAYAAIKNMHESSGNALDMAKVMRERPDLVTSSMPMSDAKIREARALSHLSDDAFKMVAGGAVEPSHAAAVGESVKDATRHADLIKEMADAKVKSAQHARVYVQQAMAAPSISETTSSLFGEETNTRSLIKERSAVLDRVMTSLKGNKKLFGMLSREADTIEAAGNKLVRDTNAANADQAARLSTLIEKLATQRGNVSTLLDQAAKQVAAGEKAPKAARAFLKSVQGAMEKGGIRALVGDGPLPLAESGGMQRMVDKPKKATAKAAAQTSFLAPATTQEQVSAAMKSAGKPTVTQLPADDGLFGSSMKQTDLVDMAKAKQPGAYGTPEYQPPGARAQSESYWSFRAERPPTVDELPPGAFKGTQKEFSSLSPGMRREIERQALRAQTADQPVTISPSVPHPGTKIPPAPGMQPSQYANNAFIARVGNQEFTAYVEQEGKYGWKVKTVSESAIDPKYGAGSFVKSHKVSGYYPSAQAAADAALKGVRPGWSDEARAASAEVRAANADPSKYTMLPNGDKKLSKGHLDKMMADAKALPKSDPTRPLKIEHVKVLAGTAWRPDGTAYTPGLEKLLDDTLKADQAKAFAQTKRGSRKAKHAADMAAIHQQIKDTIGPRGDGKHFHTDGTPITKESMAARGQTAPASAAKPAKSMVLAAIESAIKRGKREDLSPAQREAISKMTNEQVRALDDFAAKYRRSGAMSDADFNRVSAFRAAFRDRAKVTSDAAFNAAHPGWSDAAREASAEVRGVAKPGEAKPPKPAKVKPPKAPKAPAGFDPKRSGMKFVGEARTLERGPVNVFLNKRDGMSYVAAKDAPMDTAGRPSGLRMSPSGIDLAVAKLNKDHRFHTTAQKATDLPPFNPVKVRTRKPAAPKVSSAPASTALTNAAKSAGIKDPNATFAEMFKKGGKKALGILGPAAIVGAGAVAFDASRNQAHAEGKTAGEAVATGLVQGVAASTTVAAIGYGIGKGVQIAARAAPVVGKIAMKALPAVAIATAAYEVGKGAIAGYQKDGLSGAAKGAATGAADWATLGAYSHFSGKAEGENGRLSAAQQQQFAAANANWAAMQEAKQSSGKAQGWSDQARISAYISRVANAGGTPDNLPYGGAVRAPAQATQETPKSAKSKPKKHGA